MNEQLQKMETAAPAVQQPQKAPVFVGNRGLQVTDLESLWRVSTYIAKSGLAPKGIESPEAIFVAIEMGLEIGLPPMAAIQNIAVINGRPAVFGDIPLALVRSSGMLQDYYEEEVGKRNEDSWGFRCVCQRVGCKSAASTFTVADAKRAGLWGTNTWSKYPQRMLMFRARGYLLRDQFGDVLKGVKTVEELEGESAERRFQNAKPITPNEEKTPPSIPPAPNSEEKAEADTGLAPAQESKGGTNAEAGAEKAGTQSPAPATSGPPEVGKWQQQLAAEVENVGCTFDDFRKTAKSANWGEVDWDSIGGWAEVPDELAHTVWAGRRVTMRQIQEGKWKLL